MILSFTLSMPGVPSWDGKWSGEGVCYAIVKTFRKDKSDLVGSYYYHWNDGWCACVEVCQIERGEATKLRRRSRGFCGYDWMVKSIIDRKEILTDIDLEKRKQKDVVV